MCREHPLKTAQQCSSHLYPIHTEFILYILSSLYSLFSFNWISLAGRRKKTHDGIRIVSSPHNKRYLSTTIPILCVLSCISARPVRQCVCVPAFRCVDSWREYVSRSLVSSAELRACIRVSFSFRLKNNDWLEPKRWNDACSLNAVYMMWYCDERATSSELFAASWHTHTQPSRWISKLWMGNESERASRSEWETCVRVRRSRETNDPISSALWHFDN